MSAGWKPRLARGKQKLLFCLLIIAPELASAPPQLASELNRAVPPRAHRLREEGRRLAVQERLEAAEARFRQAIQLAPQFVEAHLDLVRFRAYYAQDVAGPDAEYRERAAAEPNNPVFPFVLAEGLREFWDEEGKKELLLRAANLAPDWAWSHLARALLLQREKKYEAAVAELERFLAKKPRYRRAWRLVARIEERTLVRLRRAQKAFRKLQELEGAPVSLDVWRTKLRRAGETEAARTQLRQELERWQRAKLEPRYRMVVARAYRDLLGDREAAQAIEGAVKRGYPDWGKTNHGFESTIPWEVLNQTGEPLRALVGGRQAWLFMQWMEVLTRKEARQRIAGFHALLEERPNQDLRWMMQEHLLADQISIKDWPGAKATLAELPVSWPETVELRLSVATALADEKVDLDEALRLVEETDAWRGEFRPWVRPKQFGAREWERLYATPAQQRRAHNNLLAVIESVHGWVLAQQGELEEGERRLRRAVSLNPTQGTQYRLGLVLDRRGETGEALALLVQAAARPGLQQVAARQAAEAALDKLHAAGVDPLIGKARRGLSADKRGEMSTVFVREAAKDFELVALDGQSHRLSSQRGKVVLIYFWAYWCVPCVAKMPTLNRLYQERRNQGFEILAISIDRDRAKAEAFVKEHKLPFPVFVDRKADSVESIYGVNGIPASFLIDRDGLLRYRPGLLLTLSKAGLEAMLDELMASPPSPNSPGH